MLLPQRDIFVVQSTYLRRHGRLICRLATMRYILTIVRMRYDINPFSPAGHIAPYSAYRAACGISQICVSGFISLTAVAVTNRSTDNSEFRIPHYELIFVSTYT